jgi:CheY-like chemotaxis protein
VVICRVLILEDTEERQEILTSLYRNHAWILVNTALRANKLLHAYDFDIITLDYNLGGEFTGLNVAEELLKTTNKQARVIIHSMNPAGAESLKHILPNAITYPVGKMVRSNHAFKMIRDNIDLLGSQYDWTD